LGYVKQNLIVNDSDDRGWFLQSIVIEKGYCIKEQF